MYGDEGKGDGGTLKTSDNVQSLEDDYTSEGAWARDRKNNDSSSSDGTNPSNPIKHQEKKLYTWDEENHLIKAEVGGDVLHFKYDASGQRTTKKSAQKEHIYYDKMWQVNVTRNGNIEFKNIYLGKDRLLTKFGNESKHDTTDNSYQKLNQYYNHANHIGSVNVITDSQGREFKYVEYAPYGEQWISETATLAGSGAVGPDAIEFGFTDHLHDEETELIYANARYLDPKTSRWMSSDPAMADGLNWYRYANNNPIMYMDPTGMWIDNGDGTHTAEEGDTLHGLYGDNWREESGWGDNGRDPKTLQVGETVGKKRDSNSNSGEDTQSNATHTQESTRPYIPNDSRNNPPKEHGNNLGQPTNPPPAVDNISDKGALGQFKNFLKDNWDTFISWLEKDDGEDLTPEEEFLQMMIGTLLIASGPIFLFIVLPLICAISPATAVMLAANPTLMGNLLNLMFGLMAVGALMIGAKDKKINFLKSLGSMLSPQTGGDGGRGSFGYANPF